jgi:catechol 2,3-dioxygenase-like lactoylglutathione lyase family enzyme
MPLRPHHVGINVADLDRSIEFYRGLGFELKKSWPAPGGMRIAFMALGGTGLELFAFEELPPQAPPSGEAIGFRHIAFSAEDMDATVAELKERGVVPSDAEVRVLPNGTQLLFFHDPDGVEIEIMHHD